MKKIFLIVLFFPLISASQQKQVFTAHEFLTTGNHPYLSKQYSIKLIGSPFFKDEWLEGILVESSNSKAYKLEEVKLDLLTNEIYFKDINGNEKIAFGNFKEIQLNDTVANILYLFKTQPNPNLKDSKKSQWFLQLVSGKLSLYKQTIKEIIETKSYVSGTDQRVVDSHKYFILKENNIFLPLKSIEDLPVLLPEKKLEMKAYINQLKTIKNKSEALIQAVTYYNTLLN